RANTLGGVVARAPLLHLETVPAADGDDRPSGRRRRQGGSAVGAGTEGLDVVGDVLLPDARDVVHTLRVEIGRVAVRVAAVGLLLLARRSPLDGEVVEILAQRCAQAGGKIVLAGHPGRHRRPVRTAGTDR